MNLRQLLYVLGLLLAIACSSVECHARPNIADMASPDLKEIRKRWGASDIVRDLENLPHNDMGYQDAGLPLSHHIKEDVQKITRLQDTGEISTQEALFYFLRMHDFDDNGKLDGHELLAAMTHATEHGQDSGMSLEEKETIVDTFFAYDDNMDGYVSYPELRKHLAPDPEENGNQV